MMIIQREIESMLCDLQPEVEVIQVERIGSGNGSTVRVVIDHPKGVDHELCARVTTSLKDLLSEFNLEVSSPGIERPLTKPEHFRKYIGEHVGVRTKDAIDGRRNFKGTLVGVENGDIKLKCDDLDIRIPERAIKKSNLLQRDGGARS